MDSIFDSQTLADDLAEVRRIYAGLFVAVLETAGDNPIEGKPQAWTLHETIAHLCALNGAGLESIKHTLRGEPYTFTGLESRYEFNAYNRAGINDQLDLPLKKLCAKLLETLDEAADIARNLQPGQAALTAQMAIYNRPVRIDEALSILIYHIGLNHSAQVAEPVGLPPLWTQLSSEFRRHLIGRVMHAMSLLYRYDLGGQLKAVLAFQVDGTDGGTWHVSVSPEMSAAAEGAVDQSTLTLHLRDTATFCQMSTGRLNLLTALLTGRLKLRGDLRLFLRMDTLFSVDARPKVGAHEKKSMIPRRTAEFQSK